MYSCTPLLLAAPLVIVVVLFLLLLLLLLLFLLLLLLFVVFLGDQAGWGAHVRQGDAVPSHPPPDQHLPSRLDMCEQKKRRFFKKQFILHHY